LVASIDDRACERTEQIRQSDGEKHCRHGRAATPSLLGIEQESDEGGAIADVRCRSGDPQSAELTMTED
jgi:hypothetical protein